MNIEKSKKFFSEATKSIPGGVNSPVRACVSVGTNPLFIEKANGCFVYDVDGNEFIDYVGSWGVMILGHSYHSVIEEINKAIKNGISYGAPTIFETELAESIKGIVPSIDLIRMVNSGTEAAMSAIRLARGYTGRDKIIKFDGCYHGHVDSLLVESGSGIATLAIPGSPGVTNSVVKDTISLPFNDLDVFTDVMNKYQNEIACVIVEPIAGNMGLVKASDYFLKGLRLLTEKFGSVLIFDEVMTGFRVSLGGAQELYDIIPDLTCFGKIIGGGLPVGAYGGRRDIMQQVAPEGNVYQAGTLSGNPLAMIAGMATLEELKKVDFYDKLNSMAKRLADGLIFVAESFDIPICVNIAGSMLGMYFTDNIVVDYATAKTSDLEMFKRYYKSMLESGIYVAPSQFESVFVSSSHDDLAIDRTISSFERTLKKISY